MDVRTRQASPVAGRDDGTVKQTAACRARGGYTLRMARNNGHIMEHLHKKDTSQHDDDNLPEAVTDSCKYF
jgi:hypothetical protein